MMIAFAGSADVAEPMSTFAMAAPVKTAGFVIDHSRSGGERILVFEMHCVSSDDRLKADRACFCAPLGLFGTAKVLLTLAAGACRAAVYDRSYRGLEPSQ